MIIEETSEVKYGRTTIEYGIRRSTKRTTVAVAVDPIEGVMLTAPTGVDIARLDRVVQEKAQWIVERLRLISGDETRPEPRQYTTGESFAYLGRHYRLRVRAGEGSEPARLERGWMVVVVETQLDPRERATMAERAVRDWYMNHARERLIERVGTWAEKASVTAADVVVKDQQKRWASCDDKGVLRFNWRIIQAPMRLVDYVVAHEVVHLVHRDHTKAYWARLGTLMPEYERRKEDLRKLGPRLAW